MFGNKLKKKVQKEVENLFHEIQINLENNYKDLAISARKQAEIRLEEMRKNNELSEKELLNTDSNVNFFSNADSIIIDTQYTVEEAFNKENWGHSDFSYAIDFAKHWNMKNIYFLSS